MKTTINILFVPITILCATLPLLACGDNDGDTTPPIIHLIAPAEGDTLLIGSKVHFDMELFDNEMLSSYKVEIHNNFDGHTHHRTHGNEAGIPYSFQKVWDVSGKRNTKIHHHEIEIWSNAHPGRYHLMIYCSDIAGNEAYVARNIVLSHDGVTHDHE